MTAYYSWAFYGVEYVDMHGPTHPFGYAGTYSTSPNSGSCPRNGGQPNPVTVEATDGSGYTITMQPGNGQLSVSALLDRHGAHIQVPVGAQSSAFSQQDTNGNYISSSNGQYTDTTGTTPLSVTGTAPSNTVLKYTTPSGGSANYIVSYKSYTVATNFGCSGVGEYGATSVPLVDRVTLPDSSFYQLTYEATNGQSGNVTGRLASVTLPTGGTISYGYYGGTNGIVCADGSVPGTTRVTSDGTRIYQRAGVAANAYTTLFQDEKGKSNPVPLLRGCRRRV